MKKLKEGEALILWKVGDVMRYYRGNLKDMMGISERDTVHTQWHVVNGVHGFHPELPTAAPGILHSKVTVTLGNVELGEIPA